MKSLVPWICFFVASASQQVFADEEFNAYRLGDYNKAAEPLMSKTGQDAVADYYLGRLYLYGYGQLKNNKLAMRYFTKSAEKGYLPAVQLMAKYSLFQDKNPEEAARWFKQAASVGDVNAQMYMAAAYLYGFGVKKNVDVASHYYIDAAKSGNAIAQYALAENFIDSRHSGNNKLGLIWLTKSANSGNPKALTKLGSIYFVGKLVPKDVSKALDLLNQAASQNYVPAMVELGKMALAQNEYDQALQWFNKAAGHQSSEAYLELAHAYLQEKSPIYDPKNGFLWTLKAAQDGLVEAKTELANLYKKGIGVNANEELAKQWMDQAAQDAKKSSQTSPLAQMALWLSNDKTDKMEDTVYQMNGIFSAWKNPVGLRNNTYNQAPQLEVITRQEIFKPQFALTQPNEIPINTYYDALVSKKVELKDSEWTFPIYHLNNQIEALERAYSPVVAKNNLPAPYIDASYYTYDNNSSADLMDIWTQGWQKQANYMSVFNQMYFRAILGDAQSQFEIGQMFQYGIGVTQNDQSAIIFYQNAAEQQHLGAEYNLGVLYLERAKDNADYQTALNWLTDAAFKGSKRSQYVLSRILETGKAGPDGTLYIQPNHEQAMSMLYLSAANNYGPAEYQLAEYLAREYNDGLSVDVKKHKIALIRQLYQGAASNRVAQALLPLAFYNAMDGDKQKQAEAFKVAESQADAGDEKAALLLGMLYDRGIGVSADPAKAIYWYQQSGQNPVSQFIMGTYTTEGKGVSVDKEKGLDLLKKSAEAQFSYSDFNIAVLKQQSKEDFLPDLITAYRLGNSHAGIVLADYYLAENNDTDSMNQAREIYTGLAEKGDQYAQLKLAYMMDKGLGAASNLVAAQRWYLASAEQGNPEAQYLLGQFYQLGELGEPDYNQAKLWYQKAATQLPKASVALGFIYETVDDNYADALKSYEMASEQGDVLGDYNLALMYEYGKGVPVDYQKAKALFTTAADKGVDEAMNQLGGMYFYGLGQPRNAQQALSWYKKAAELGNSNALYALGLLSETGVATKLDFPDALKYYKEASDKGNEKAMLALARMYHYGLGVEKDPRVSASIYEKLAERQNAYAQYQLGTYYIEGTAGEQSAEKGRKLLEQASENGNMQARKVLRRLDAQTQARVSYVEPVQLNDVPVLEGSNADLIYLDALNEWNRGDEVLSRMILQRLVTQYPNFVPAKRTYEQLNQARLTRTYG
ncbi:tetratricopeptide repeat protein [Legionella bononiensis]|uniref:SEL1-like repeat protein n=1 Tax=Legionella bononiensis TaxID=2793102 RepID=A0ABS1WA79_9GAMM|nr:SEL1-like repeat protein [Legionella bononiensis]MBL7480493.1 SEL1-like repeat protein [Legionella bononiensis]MBL7526267.1 SEL1-like repeat protein [Legionella bononiensis]MBL7563237.1 SEL1-like repeat protein [Legionella bononiensis]